MTYKDLVNAVLRRLRETECNSVQDTAYTKLIGDFVNETKQEVENSYQWNALYGNISFVTVPGTAEYTLTGTGRRTVFLDTYNVTKQYPICDVPTEYINLHNTVAVVQQDSPVYWAVTGQDDTTEAIKVTLYPTPNAVETIRFYVYNPQADLSSDTDNMKVPTQPVIDGAWARAISERGEDGGRMADAQFGIYKATLADYIALEAGRNGNDLVWERV